MTTYCRQPIPSCRNAPLLPAGAGPEGVSARAGNESLKCYYPKENYSPPGIRFRSRDFGTVSFEKHPEGDVCRDDRAVKGEDMRDRMSARDAIRTHEPLQERILSPSELAGLSYPRALNYYPSHHKKNPLCRSLLLIQLPKGGYPPRRPAEKNPGRDTAVTGRPTRSRRACRRTAP